MFEIASIFLRKFFGRTFCSDFTFPPFDKNLLRFFLLPPLFSGRCVSILDVRTRGTLKILPLYGGKQADAILCEYGKPANPTAKNAELLFGDSAFR
ncbi:hypothetical protein P3B99_009160 [Opitutia bacterium KCR 482]|nr:hypothetical protein [Opitutae bacterium KCR 482]